MHFFRSDRNAIAVSTLPYRSSAEDKGETGFSCAQSVFGAARGLPYRFIRGDEKKPVRRAAPYRCATQRMNRCFLLRRRIPSRPFGKSRYACVLIPRRKS
jgi:hypothetical protein